MCWKDEPISLGLSDIEVTPKTSSAIPEQYVEEHDGDLQALGDTVAFEIRLAETIAWCIRHADILEPRDSLRSDELKPEFVCNENLYLYDSAKRIKDIRQLLEKRSKLLGKEIASVATEADLKGGKLIVYFPDENVFDGASEVASMEFFDGEDEPAWDTWVGLFRDYKREYIVSYIPPQFLSLVNDGIEVNCVDCIQWIDNSTTKLAIKLRQKGIIPKDRFRFRL